METPPPLPPRISHPATVRGVLEPGTHNVLRVSVLPTFVEGSSIIVSCPGGGTTLVTVTEHGISQGHMLVVLGPSGTGGSKKHTKMAGRKPVGALLSGLRAGGFALDRRIKKMRERKKQRQQAKGDPSKLISDGSAGALDGEEVESGHTRTHSKGAQRSNLTREGSMETVIAKWRTKVLPNWDQMCGKKMVRNLCIRGIPSSIRGSAWCISEFIHREVNVCAHMH